MYIYVYICIHTHTHTHTHTHMLQFVNQHYIHMYTFSNLSINNASTHSLAPVAEIHSLKYHPRTYKALEFAWRRRRRIYSYSEIL